MKDPNSDNLDTLIAAVKADKPSDIEIEAAAHRVRQKLAQEASSEQEVVINKGVTNEQVCSEQTQFNSLEQYIEAIPDYLSNRLSPALTELFEAESRQSMELRRALNNAKKTAIKNSGFFKHKSILKALILI